MTTRRAIEGRMLRELGMTADAAARLHAHNERQTDWHGSCQRCGIHFTGAIAEAGKPCPKCGYGGESGSPSP